MKNPYEVLGVSPKDGYETIKNAYRRLCKKYHPDISGVDSVEKFREINEAWNAINNCVGGYEPCEMWVHDSLFSISKRRM